MTRAWKARAKRLLPAPLRHRLEVALQPTVAAGWEHYAKSFKSRNAFLGDEWTDPAKMGADVAAGRLVQHLDESIFAPFLGSCDVLVEIGAGGGRFTEVLLPRSGRLIAAEASPTMLKLLRRRFPDEENLECLLVRGADLEGVADRSVDGVFSYGVFVHLHHWDIFSYLQEIRRVLKPDGRCIIQHANTFSDLGWETFLGDLPTSVGRHKAPGAFTPMTPELMEAFCRKAGLEVTNCVTNVVRRDAITMIRVRPGS